MKYKINYTKLTQESWKNKVEKIVQTLQRKPRLALSKSCQMKIQKD